MIDQTNLSFGQKVDSEVGILFPWYTHGALDRINPMNFSNKNVLEFGGGASTLWWACRAKQVYTIDTNPEWAANTIDSLDKLGLSHRATVELRQINEGDQTMVETYTKIPDGFEPDVVIVDGILRFEAMQKALTLKRPLLLIVDNWMQDWIFDCPAAEEMMKPYPGEIYPQHDHTDHNGKKWQTAIWELR